MANPLLDPKGFFQFDLANGEVRAQGDERVLVLSQSALAPLIATAVRSGDLTPIRELGNQLGSWAAASLGSPADSLPPAIVISHASSLMALHGWGRLQLEQWGDALVLEVQQLPPLDGENLAVAALLGGLFSTLASREVACVPVGNTNRYVVVDPSIAERVWGWSKAGRELPAIVSRLAQTEAP